MIVGGMVATFWTLPVTPVTVKVKHEENVAVPVRNERDLHPAQLVELSEEELGKIDVGLMNLLCAKGLPSEQPLSIDAGMAKLQEITATVHSETARNLHRWTKRPQDYQNSKPYYLVGMMVTVLAQDFGIRYNPAKISAPSMAELQDLSFYRNTDDVMLTGCLGTSHQGTCASLPVLAVAVGRRLGYPMKLVCAKAHLFCRWDDGNTKLNFEYTNGVVTRPDEYYKNEPFPVTPFEEKKGWYLQSLTPRQELSIFLSLRGQVLAANQKTGESLVAHSLATLMWPGHRDQGVGLIQAAEARFEQIGFYKLPEATAKTTSASDPYFEVR